MSMALSGEDREIRLALRFFLYIVLFKRISLIVSIACVNGLAESVIGMKVGRYLIVFVLLMGALITFGDRGLIDNYRLKEKLMTLKKINHGTILENIALKKNITFLREDLSYIEMMARNDLGMVKKGDLVYRTAK
jgi:cell division protein FtsB